jgi:ribonuclease R
VHCSANERRADEASRDVENWLKCYFMKDKLGEEFTGVISGVTPFGIFVQLDELFVEGLVHVTGLGTDYFQYDEARHELRGERTGKVYQLTDRVTVQVARVDLEARKIDLVLAAGGSRRRCRRRRAARAARQGGRAAAPRIARPRAKAGRRAGASRWKARRPKRRDESEDVRLRSRRHPPQLPSLPPSRRPRRSRRPPGN